MTALRLILLIFLCVGHSLLLAQDTIFLSRLNDRVLLSDTQLAVIANSAVRHFGEIEKKNEWRGLDSQMNEQGQSQGWLKMTVHNDLKTDEFFDLDFRAADSIIVFARKKDTTVSYVTGPYTDVRRWLFQEQPGLVPIFCQPGETVDLYVRLWSYKGRPFSLSGVYLQNRLVSLKTSVEAYRSFIGRIEFNGFFLGAVTFAMIFFLLIFIRLREPAFLLYGLYLLGAGVYSIVVKTLPYSFLARIAYLDFPLTYKLGEPVQYLFFAAYIAFGKSLLDIDQRYGLLHRLIKIFIRLLLIAGTGLLIYNFYHFEYQLQRYAFVLSRIAILPIGLILLVWIAVSVRNRIKWFFVTGSSLFFIGGMLAVIVDPKSRHLFFGQLDISSVMVFKTGILLESLCFALALGYKMRVAQIDKEKTAQAYIEQLELNKKMAASETERLERMVAERTQTLIEQTRLIEEQKQVQLQTSFERQLSEMEMSALRSQMNPHFIFNSLNSIRYQILRKDYDTAATYLTRFSKLLRYILQNSREHVVSLAEEIEVNRLYVQLESLRFDQGLDFVLNIPDEIDTTDILIPPMLLQPYVENAVKHGLIPSKKPLKKLMISISADEDGYTFIIEDNGIGRKASAQRTMVDDKQSLGMKIASERIALFNLNFHPFIDVNIEDLYESTGPRGTLVTFTYKTKS
ncbi:histidine kinase [Dyadobacter helix]|nr:histidine kinase [Dyadobacter sp. CECT 9275]